MAGFISVGNDTTQRLINIQTGINQLLAGNSGNGLSFTLLNLSPTYTINSSNGWTVSPTNLSAIYDGESNTSTNLFEVAGGAYRWGEIIINPGISIPLFTRINFRVGLQNASSNRSYFELAVYNVPAAIWTSIWGTLDNQSSSQSTIVNIDRIIPFIWDKIRFQVWDSGTWPGRASISGLEVWAVT